MSEITPHTQPEPIKFHTHPSRYQHWKLKVEGPIAWLYWDVSEDKGLRPGYKLKLNSYDLGVDIELNDAVNRLRFEHPEVSVVCLESGKEGIFSAGANIFMLGLSSHSHKVNFCKFTNETRNSMEEASEKSGQYYVASLNGTASGGGYELPLACKEIHLMDDKRASVSLPEVPFLGVLPGTGGLTRLIDKRGVRRDLADIFVTLAEGLKGQTAMDYRIVDFIHPPTSYREDLEKRLNSLVDHQRAVRSGVELDEIIPKVEVGHLSYKFVDLKVETGSRKAVLTLKGPNEKDSEIPEDPTRLKATWYPLQAFRELEDAIFQLRHNFEEVGLVCFYFQGDGNAVLALDKALQERKDHWFIKEILLLQGRVLKRLDVTAKSLFSFLTPGHGCWGSLFEIALSCDRIYLMNPEGSENPLSLSSSNLGTYPMGHGLSRLENRFYGQKENLAGVGEGIKDQKVYTPEEALKAGLVSGIPDDLDWEDEVRLMCEERLSLSPDSLTGMEANLRFVGPESMETRIFGRLSAWQNWIFTRPNATGERGALTSYGKAFSPEFDWRRT